MCIYLYIYIYICYYRLGGLPRAKQYTATQTYKQTNKSNRYESTNYHMNTYWCALRWNHLSNTNYLSNAGALQQWRIM